jgi:hypothetical protein
VNCISPDKENHMRIAKLLLIGFVALLSTSCASAPSAPPASDISGKWQGTWVFQNPSLGNGQIMMTISQTGSKATGNMVVTGAPVDRTGAVTMVVSGNDVYLVYPTGITGYLVVSGDEMKGQLDGMNPGNVVLKRQK